MTNCALKLVVLSLLSFISLQTGAAGERRRIVNGTAVSIQDIPYQVALLKYPNSDDETLMGGGSIISSTWVLTAAHVFRNSVRVRATLLGVRIGSSSSVRGEVFDVAGIRIHPQYKPSNKDNDFALVRLRQPYTENGIAKHVQLVEAGEQVAAGTLCTASGWGETMGTGKDHQLNAVKVPIVSHDLCKENYAASRLTITENMMCAGYDEGLKDACFGDSGGPLICNDKLVGVISWGKDCAQPKFYGVYAVVANARDWIKQNAEV